MEVIVSVQNCEDIRLRHDLKCTAGEIKSSLYSILELKGQKTELRLLYRGKELKDEDTILEIEKDIAETKKIHLFAVKPVAKSAAHQRVNNVRLLHRNVAECAKCSQKDVEPNDRIRFNDPDIPTPHVPNVLYVADMIQDIGNTFNLMSKNLKQMSEVLKSTELFDGEESHRRIRLIQNNMDCVRYTHPMLLNISKLRLPITDPRELVQTEVCWT